MRTALAIVLLAASAAAASAQSNYGGYGTGSNPQSHSVQGHYNSNGTYTQPYQATNPNNTQADNYSARGNYNPYSGT
jgi:hypothetical protein